MKGPINKKNTTCLLILYTKEAKYILTMLLAMILPPPVLYMDNMCVCLLSLVSYNYILGEPLITSVKGPYFPTTLSKVDIDIIIQVFVYLKIKKKTFPLFPKLNVISFWYSLSSPVLTHHPLT